MNANRSEYAILGMLSLRPMSGYDIRKTVEQSIAHFWNESYGQIYPTLRRLATRGFVVRRSGNANGRSDRQVYALTKSGQIRLREWLAEAPESRPFRNELLLKLFFGRHAPPVAALNQVHNFRKQQLGYLKTYEKIVQQLKLGQRGHPDVRFWLITLSYGRRQARALLGWCDETLAALATHTKPSVKVRRVRGDS